MTYCWGAAHTPGMARKEHSPKAVREAFATRLKKVRERAGFKQQNTFADELGIEAETYRRWERGETEPGLFSLQTIASATGVSLDHLVAGKIGGGHQSEAEPTDAAVLTGTDPAHARQSASFPGSAKKGKKARPKG